MDQRCIVISRNTNISHSMELLLGEEKTECKIIKLEAEDFVAEIPLIFETDIVFLIVDNASIMTIPTIQIILASIPSENLVVLSEMINKFYKRILLSYGVINVFDLAFEYELLVNYLSLTKTSVLPNEKCSIATAAL